MKLGADRKRLMLLGGLLVAMGGLYFYLTRPDDVPRSAAAAAAASSRGSATGATASSAASGGGAGVVSAASRPPAPGASGGAQTPNLARAGSQQKTNEFRPSIGGKKGEHIAPETVDPTLRLDLLAHVQQVTLGDTGGGMRSLFDFGAAPKPPGPPKPVTACRHCYEREIGPEPPAPPVPPPPPPPPPPITLKFYGYVNSPRSGRKRAFFIDGEDIFVASEGEIVKRHYKIVRINLNSAVVEDTDNKNQQTITLVEEQQG